MEETWSKRDLPVLDAIVRMRDAKPLDPGPSYGDLAQETGLPLDEITRAVASLEGSFVEVSKVMAGGFTGNWRITQLSPSARQAVGQWPTAEAYADRLMEVLREEEGRASTPERRSKIRAVLDALGGIGHDVLVDVSAKVITGSMGM
jgi:hypothetical protein